MGLPLGNSQSILSSSHHHAQLCVGSALSTQAGRSWQMGKGYCLKPVPTGRGGGN